jgi:hypothetical protein
LVACGGGQDAPGAQASTATTTSAADPCSGKDLSVSQANIMAYTFHDLFVYALKNTGASPCTLTGYPQLIGFAASGANLHANFVDTTDSPVYQGASTAAVTLQPGWTLCWLDRRSRDGRPVQCRSKGARDGEDHSYRRRSPSHNSEQYVPWPDHLHLPIPIKHGVAADGGRYVDDDFPVGARTRRVGEPLRWRTGGDRDPAAVASPRAANGRAASVLARSPLRFRQAARP